jgi:hypothetical protein
MFLVAGRDIIQKQNLRDEYSAEPSRETIFTDAFNSRKPLQNKLHRKTAIIAHRKTAIIAKECLASTYILRS